MGISDIIIEKGVDFLADRFQLWLSSNGNTADIPKAVQLIDEKINYLINSPYECALMYLRENELLKCKDKLIEAISNNEYNLPARLLYISFLISEKKYDIAFEQYWKLIEIHGIIKDIIPQFVVDIYKNEVWKYNRVPSEPILCCPSVKYEDFDKNNYVLDDLYITPSVIVIKWIAPGNPNAFLLSKKRYTHYIMEIRNIETDKTIFYNKKGNVNILKITNRFVLIDYNYNTVLIKNETGDIDNSAFLYFYKNPGLENDLFHIDVSYLKYGAISKYGQFNIYKGKHKHEIQRTVYDEAELSGAFEYTSEYEDSFIKISFS